MSKQDMPTPAMTSDVGLFLEPTAATPLADPLPVAHHPQPKPQDHMCTCGKVREACVHEEIRALWNRVAGS